ncbi:MAG: hypothetical protein RR652_04405 [Mucinivorans sp.]
MKTRLIISFVGFVVFCLVGCKNEPIDQNEPIVSREDAQYEYEYAPMEYKSDFYIIGYIIPSEFIARRGPYLHYPYIPFCYDIIAIVENEKLDTVDNEIWTVMENLASTVEFYVIPKKIKYVGFKHYSRFNQLLNDYDSFFKIAQQNKDVSYYDYNWDPALYYNEPAQVITMSCTTDYDAQHPANTPLDDIVMINYFTAKPFIDSRYKNKRLGDHRRSRIDELLSVFNAKKVALVASDFGLCLTKNPEKAGLYSFIITYRDSKGQEFSATSKPTRLKAR